LDRHYGDARYTSVLIEDRAEGSVGYGLVRIQQGVSRQMARILYWDASGQFAVEIPGGEVPLEVLEELIAEAKATIKRR
jgi:hypothetical protein